MILRHEISKLEQEIEDAQLNVEGFDRSDREQFPEWLTHTRKLVAFRARRVAMMEVLGGTYRWVDPADRPSVTQGPVPRGGPTDEPILDFAEQAALQGARDENGPRASAQKKN